MGSRRCLLVCLVLLLGCGGSTDASSDGGVIDASDSDGSTASAYCPNRAIEEPEACDDGNMDDGDGCDGACAIEVGWTCAGEPSICNRAVSCKEVLESGATQSGTYVIDPDGPAGEDPYTVYCDMETDGGGWTMIVNNDNADTEPAGCHPRIATVSGFVCGALTVNQDFAVPANGIPFQELVWASYTGTFELSAYTYMSWTNPTAFPNTDTFEFVADEVDKVLTDYSIYPRIHCDANQGGLAAVINAAPANGSSDYGTSIVTVLDRDGSGVAGGRMSLTDTTNGPTTNTQGLDDFQDSLGCGDGWQPKSERGLSSFIMIR